MYTFDTTTHTCFPSLVPDRNRQLQIEAFATMFKANQIHPFCQWQRLPEAVGFFLNEQCVTFLEAVAKS